jgi:hypothetical protein
MWNKYCRIYPEFAQKNNNNALLKVQPIYENWLIAQDKMKSRFYKIKCTTASDQVLNCQSEIVILNNLSHSVTSMLIL